MATAKEVTYTTVTMDDGREVKFPGDRQVQKEALFDHPNQGDISVRFDFVSGETRCYQIPDALLGQFAAHGALQKYGDTYSGIKDIEGKVQAVDDLNEVIQSGSWTAVSESTGAGLAGASILARALVEVTSQPIAVVREYLKTLDAKTKAALRLSAEVSPTIQKLEAEKAARAAARGKVAAAKVDTSAALAGLMAKVAQPA
jgi:hypothetical protein